MAFDTDSALNHREWVEFTESIEAFGVVLPSEQNQPRAVILLADRPILFRLNDWEEIMDTWDCLASYEQAV
jgi:hypothetical protein